MFFPSKYSLIKLEKVNISENDTVFSELDNVKETLFVNSEGLQVNGNVFKEFDEGTFAKMFDITEPNVPNFVNNKKDHWVQL